MIRIFLSFCVLSLCFRTGVCWGSAYLGQCVSAVTQCVLNRYRSDVGVNGRTLVSLKIGSGVPPEDMHNAGESVHSFNRDSLDGRMCGCA